jgi:hypothetical protein
MEAAATAMAAVAQCRGASRPASRGSTRRRPTETAAPAKREQGNWSSRMSNDTEEAADAGAMVLKLKISIKEMDAVEAWALKRGATRSRSEAIRRLIALGLEADRKNRAAETLDRARLASADAERARSEYQGQKDAENEKTERLRMLRLAKEAHDLRLAKAEEARARPAPPKRSSAARAKR